MRKSAIFFWSVNLCAFTLCSAGVMNRCTSSQTRQEDCGCGPEHMRVAVRYTTPKGIGYNEGYTTLEGFFAPRNFYCGNWVPFLDLRGHMFDNGKAAANAGLGLRYLTDSRVWGANAYYDYRDTSHEHYNQVAAGLESLGRIWDFRINGYLPVGKKVSPHFHTRFQHFAGNQMFIRSKRDFAMKGANAEAGVHVDRFEKAPLYFAAGPYYLTGKGDSAWGGEFRATLGLFNEHLRLEGNVSYDHFFEWIGQGQVSLNFTFGGRNRVTKRACQSCCTALALERRAVQRVDRAEIIPVGREQVTATAIDPATGLPFFVLFVDNTSHSLGTFESPFPTLLAAQNASAPGDIIYVFPGDGTTTGMNAGITLQNAQMLLGASSPQPILTTFGTVTIPPQAAGLPHIGNPSGNIVTLAASSNDNTVSGFFMNIQGAPGNSGISGVGTSNFTASQNTFVTSAITTDGISLTNFSGELSIDSSTFSGFSSNGSGISLTFLPDGLSNLDVSGCTFSHFSHSIGIFATLANATVANFNVSDCAFSGFSMRSDGISATIDGGTLLNHVVSGCAFSGFNDSTGNQVLVNVGSNINNYYVSNCTYSGFSTSSGAIADIAGGTLANYNVSDCTFSGFDASKGAFAAVTGAINNFIVSGSNFVNLSNSSFGVDAAVGTYSIAGGILTNYIVSDCTFLNISGSSDGIVNSIFSGGTITNCFVTDSNFNGIATGSRAVEFDSFSTLTNSTVSGSTFSGFNAGTGVKLSIASDDFVSNVNLLNCTFLGIDDINSGGLKYFTDASSLMNVSGNIFTSNGSGVATGYATQINVDNGTTCLEFIDNNTFPLSGVAPYLFAQTGGTFGLTVGSDASTNTGTIQISGSVGAPGSCTE